MNYVFKSEAPHISGIKDKKNKKILYNSTSLLHDLGSREARELAESIAAIDDRIGGRDLRIAQHEVRICNVTIVLISL